MPKEYVFPESGDVCGFRVRVGWDREGELIQLATIDPDREDMDQRDGGLYVTLDRNRTNDLIRILRRARDQAFGRDE